MVVGRMVSGCIFWEGWVKARPNDFLPAIKILIMHRDMERLQFNITPTRMMKIIIIISNMSSSHHHHHYHHDAGGHGTTSAEHHTNGNDGQGQKRRASRNAGAHIIFRLIRHRENIQIILVLIFWKKKWRRKNWLQISDSIFGEREEYFLFSLNVLG